MRSFVVVLLGGLGCLFCFVFFFSIMIWPN